VQRRPRRQRTAPAISPKSSPTIVVKTVGRRFPFVAIGIAGSRPVGTIAPRECDRRAGDAVRRSRTAEFGRLHSSGTGVVEPDADASYIAEAEARVEPRQREKESCDTGRAAQLRLGGSGSAGRRRRRRKRRPLTYAEVVHGRLPALLLLIAKHLDGHRADCCSLRASMLCVLRLATLRRRRSRCAHYLLPPEKFGGCESGFGV